MANIEHITRWLRRKKEEDRLLREYVAKQWAKRKPN